MNTYTSYGELTSAATQYLRDIGRSKESIRLYNWAWGRLEKYMSARNVSEYSEKVALEYIEATFGQKKLDELTHYQKDHLRQVVSLSHFIKTGKIPIYINRKPQYELNSGFNECVQSYLEHKRTMRVSATTLKQHRWHLYQFTEYLSNKGVQSIQFLSPLDIMRYATESFPHEPAAKNASLIILRRFLRYLYDKEYIKRDLSLIVPKDYYRQQAKLPSTYSKDEVRTILASIDRSKNIGKRDYAIIILAVRLGMRASDIAELQFNEIQWAIDKISFTQMKTGRAVQLPLPSDVGESIINYVQNGRPLSDSPYVFLSPRYPHNPIDSSAISAKVRKIIVESGVKIGNRKHGPHSLRHTMASFMINEETSLPIISEILGHSSVQTSMNYLRISVEAMRQCAAEVPLVPTSFYEQKGGHSMGNFNKTNMKDSILSPYIADFIRLKRGLGYKAERIEDGLWAFDTFAKNKGNTEIALPKELVEEWCAKRPNETTKTWGHRANCLRQLSTYLFNLGYNAYIPISYHIKQDNPVPYIYSDAELEAIFTATDMLVQRRDSPHYCLFPVPAMIRMLAGTGIRLGEAVDLLDKDVDLERNCLTLRDTKNRRERFVPISESLSEVCRQYRKYRSLLPYIHSDTFFVKQNGTKCTNESFGHWWNMILKKAGIPHLGKQRGPRVHDLRHTFCVKTLARLAREGKDLYYIMPILSMYIGHLSLKATDRYVRLTSEMFPELLSQTDSICTYIYPRFKPL